MTTTQQGFFFFIWSNFAKRAPLSANDLPIISFGISHFLSFSLPNIRCFLLRWLWLVEMQAVMIRKRTRRFNADNCKYKCCRVSSVATIKTSLIPSFLMTFLTFFVTNRLKVSHHWSNWSASSPTVTTAAFIPLFPQHSSHRLLFL